MRNILFIAPSTPFDSPFGGAIRVRHLHEVLGRLGAVTFLLLREGSAFRARSPMHRGVAADVEFRSNGILGKYEPSTEVNDWIERHLPIDRFDVIVARHLTPASKIAPIPGQPMLVDADDLDYRYPVASPGIAANGAAAVKRLLRRNLAVRALRRFDHVWFGTERDMRRARLPNASLAPNFLPDAPADGTIAPLRPANRLLFVGALWYEPNRDGVDWFLRRCWPTLKAARPDLTLRIVGAGPAPLRERWSAIDGVESPGFVDDIALEYRSADVVIAPIRCGGGFQIKVLESLVHARPAVVTPFVAAGFGNTLSDGEAVAIEATPAGFVAACLALLGDGTRAAQMGAHGRAVAARHYTRAAFEHAIQSVVERIAPAG